MSLHFSFTNFAIKVLNLGNLKTIHCTTKVTFNYFGSLSCFSRILERTDNLVFSSYIDSESYIIFCLILPLIGAPILQLFPDLAVFLSLTTSGMLKF